MLDQPNQKTGTGAVGQCTDSADFSSVSCEHCGGPTAAIQMTPREVHYLRFCSDRCANSGRDQTDDPWAIARRTEGEGR